MGIMTESESFISIRNALKAYIINKKLIPTLMKLTNTKSRTSFYDTFSVKSSDELVGKKLEIWNAATSLVEGSKEAVNRAEKALKNE